MSVTLSIRKQAESEYLNLLSPFKLKVTEELIAGANPEKLAVKYAKSNKMSLRVAKAHVTRAVQDYERLKDGLKEYEPKSTKTSTKAKKTDKKSAITSLTKSGVKSVLSRINKELRKSGLKLELNLISLAN